MYKTRRLERPNGMIAGVCAGIANRYGIPTFLVRILFLLALAPGGVPGVLLYLALWVLIPKA